MNAAVSKSDTDSGDKRQMLWTITAQVTTAMHGLLQCVQASEAAPCTWGNSNNSTRDFHNQHGLIYNAYQAVWYIKAYQ